MKYSHPERRGAFALCLLALLGLPGLVAAAQPSGTDETEPASREVTEAAGLRVTIDPETGEIVDEPSYTALGRLTEGVDVEPRRSAWELREFSLPTGGRGVYLDGFADHSFRVVIDAEGKIRASCTQDHRHEPAGGGEDDER